MQSSIMEVRVQEVDEILDDTGLQKIMKKPRYY